MNAHTPGPWKADEDRMWVIAPADGVIAECDPDSKRSWSAQPLANARLIAAAPEMYEALCAVQDTFWADHRIPGDVRKDWEAVYHNLVCAALRKVIE